MGCGSSKNSAEVDVPSATTPSVPNPHTPSTLSATSASLSTPKQRILEEKILDEGNVTSVVLTSEKAVIEAPYLVSESEISNQEISAENHPSPQYATTVVENSTISVDVIAHQTLEASITTLEPLSSDSNGVEQDSELSQLEDASQAVNDTDLDQEESPPIMNMAQVNTIQRVWRGSVGRRLHKRAVQEHQRQVSASVLLQCLWRCRVSCRTLVLLKELEATRKRKERACLLIQSLVRVLIARRVAEERRRVAEERRRQLSALAIQNAFRGHWSRVQLKQLREAAFKRLVVGVLLSQRLWRGSRARVLFCGMREERRLMELEKTSSIVLQCRWRCWVSHRCLQELRRLDAIRKCIASTKIQSRVRMTLAQRRLRDLRSAALASLERRSATCIQVPLPSLSLFDSALSLLPPRYRNTGSGSHRDTLSASCARSSSFLRPSSVKLDSVSWSESQRLSCKGCTVVGGRDALSNTSAVWTGLCQSSSE
jgi:hypothetical protein